MLSLFPDIALWIVYECELFPYILLYLLIEKFALSPYISNEFFITLILSSYPYLPLKVFETPCNAGYIFWLLVYKYTSSLGTICAMSCQCFGCSVG